MGLRAMFSAVSGLQSHSTWLDVIGNNISNVNTVAYKSSRVTFSDAMSQTSFSGSGPSASSNLGGTNPQQVGLGTRVSSIQTLFNPGPLLQTGNATDVAIQGDGFLVVKQGTSTVYSRAGNLTFDGDGNLVDANGGLIQGFQARIQYNQTAFNSESSILPGPAASANDAMITRAELILDTSSMADVGNIQIKKGMTLPPRATSIMEITGNLDSFLQATDSARGGIFEWGTPVGTLDLLPMGWARDQGVAMFGGTKMLWPPVANPTTGNFYCQQVADLAGGVVANAYMGGMSPSPVVVAGVDLTGARNNGAGYAWEVGQPAAHTVVQTAYDSLGNQREVTVLFYQVNDLGDAFTNAVPPGSIGNNPTGPSQVAYAWYAFETTGGVPPATANLLGGTAIIEGDYGTGYGTAMSFDRGIVNAGSRAQFCGDLLYFNTDGSLASMGGVAIGGTGGFAASYQADARVYLPPLNYFAAGAGTAPVSPLPTTGAEVMSITLDFGSSGGLGVGLRNGLYSDAAGSYQMIDGVNTYIPNQTAFCNFQDGYSEGQLLGVNFDETGIMKGTFQCVNMSQTQTVDLAQLVLARVSNPEGLNKVGDSYYASSSNSGPVYVGLAGRQV